MSFIILVLLFAAILYLLFAPIKSTPTNGYIANVIAHSKSEGILPIQSFLLRYPRFIHSEIMTHKDFSRSAMSSRAVPVTKIISQVWFEPAMPLAWGKNKAGMQSTEQFSPFMSYVLTRLWVFAGRLMCCIAYLMVKLNVHKQFANRLLEPWQFMYVTLTTVKIANFFALRIHPAAQPEIRYLATLMRDALEASCPIILQKHDWHLPWIEPQDKTLVYAYLSNLLKTEPSKEDILNTLLAASAARCARSSYANFDGTRSIEKDMATFSKLTSDVPKHASPCEHQASPDPSGHFKDLHGNLTGWIQHRNTIPQHYTYDKP